MIKLSALFLLRLRQTPCSQRMSGGKIQEVKLETFDKRLVNAYNAMIANTLVSTNTAASVQCSSGQEQLGRGFGRINFSFRVAGVLQPQAAWHSATLEPESRSVSVVLSPSALTLASNSPVCTFCWSNSSKVLWGNAL